MSKSKQMIQTIRETNAQAKAAQGAGDTKKAAELTKQAAEVGAAYEKHVSGC
jgi:hypothetical protein